MGLSISHGAFRGAYSAFNRLRQAICHAMDGSWPPHRAGWLADGEPPLPGSFYVDERFTRRSNPGLYALLDHSDCDGEIAPDDAAKMADELEALVPALERVSAEYSVGHLSEGVVTIVRRLISGARAAADAGEPLHFS